MATKKCPFCAEEIQEEAIFCKHCKRDLVPEDSPRAEAPRADQKAKKNVNIDIYPALAFLVVLSDLPPRTSPPSKLDLGPFQVHSTG